MFLDESIGYALFRVENVINTIHARIDLDEIDEIDGIDVNMIKIWSKVIDVNEIDQHAKKRHSKFELFLNN